MGYITEQELEGVYDDIKGIRDTIDEKITGGNLIFSSKLTPLEFPTQVFQTFQPMETLAIFPTKELDVAYPMRLSNPTQPSPTKL